MNTTTKTKNDAPAIVWELVKADNGRVTVKTEPIKGFLPDGLTVTAHMYRTSPSASERYPDSHKGERMISVNSYNAEPVRFGLVEGVLDGEAKETRSKSWPDDGSEPQEYKSWHAYIIAKRVGDLFQSSTMPERARKIGYEVGKSLAAYLLANHAQQFDRGELVSRLATLKTQKSDARDMAKRIAHNEEKIQKLAGHLGEAIPLDAGDVVAVNILDAGTQRDGKQRTGLLITFRDGFQVVHNVGNEGTLGHIKRLFGTHELPFKRTMKIKPGDLHTLTKN